jgi:hypothetical protein
VKNTIVDVVKDGYITANAAIRLKNDIKVLLHNGIDESDINVTTDIPESFNGDVTKVFAHVSLATDTPLMYTQIGDFELETSVTEYDNAVPVSSGEAESETGIEEKPPEQSPGSSPNGIIIALQTIGIILGIIFLIIIVIIY